MGNVVVSLADGLLHALKYVSTVLSLFPVMFRTSQNFAVSFGLKSGRWEQCSFSSREVQEFHVQQTTASSAQAMSCSLLLYISASFLFILLGSINDQDILSSSIFNFLEILLGAILS